LITANIPSHPTNAMPGDGGMRVGVSTGIVGRTAGRHAAPPTRAMPGEGGMRVGVGTGTVGRTGGRHAATPTFAMLGRGVARANTLRRPNPYHHEPVARQNQRHQLG
jgi:hypothetical protein